MSSIGDDDRSDIDHFETPETEREGSLSVWDFFHRILSGRAEFRRLIILVIILLAGLALLASIVG